MVTQQLRSLGLRIRPPTPDDVRCPRGKPAPARPGWEQFLVAQKPVGEPWPAGAKNQIAAARRCYEAGTHEMVSCTTKDGWTQLYLKPRKSAAAPRAYFTKSGAA